MGCLSSKPDAESGDRIVAEVPQTVGQPHDTNARQPVAASPSAPISMPGRSGGGPSKLSSHGLSQSYTEARLAEEELFEGIIRKTEHNLINAGDLQEDYAGSTRNAMQRLVECNSLMLRSGTYLTIKLPIPSSANTDVGVLLGAPLAATLLINAAANDLNAAFACVDVTDVGAVVMDLPAIPVL